MKTFRQLIAAALFAIVMCPLTATAQDTQEKTPATTGGMQYVFGKGSKFRLSGFGAPIAELSFINDQPVLSTGGGGALLINQKFFVGAYSVSSVTRLNDFVWESNQPPLGVRPVFVQVGSWLGYNFNPHRAFHFTASTKIGYALLADAYYQDSDWRRRQGYTEVGSFMITPEIAVEGNLFKWMRVNVGAGYRYVANQSLAGNKTSSPVFTGSLMFGWFK
jgi:hypothetical protein